ncbi:MAG: DNRLRE domain-containing protein, partial [Cytophagales bacterium]|nr:DNRLRE domain-containing protein [Cytophagales bacterium]
MFYHYPKIFSAGKQTRAWRSRLFAACLALLFAPGLLSFAQAPATVAVSGTQAGISTRYMGMQGGDSPSATAFIDAVDDLGLNAFRFFTTMNRYEPEDDVPGYGYPTREQLLAADPSDLLGTNTLIDWSKYEVQLNRDRDNGQTDAVRFAMFREKGIKVLANLQLNQRGPDWAPTFATTPTQADKDEWWQSCYANALLLNKKHDFRIDDYEIGNEPNLGSEGFRGTMATYYEMVRIAKDAIKEAYARHLPGRTYRIYAPAPAWDDFGWIDGVLKNVPDDFDHVSFHKYGVLTSMDQGVRNVRNWAANRQVWLTEWGTWENGFDQTQVNNLSVNIDWIKLIMTMSTPGASYVDGWHYYKLFHSGYAGGDGLIDKRTFPYKKEKAYYGLRLGIRALNGGKPVYGTQTSTGDLTASTSRNADGTYSTLIANTSNSYAYRAELNLSSLVADQEKVTLYRFDAANNDARFRGPALVGGKTQVIVPPKGAVLYVTGSTTWETDPEDAVDNQPPAAVTNLTVPAKSATTADLAWSPATDNIGVASYNVYQGAVLVRNVTQTSFQATSLDPATSYTFTVRTVDFFGNEAPATSVVVMTTETGPVVNSLLPLADTYVQQGNAGTNYGALDVIRVKGVNDGLQRRSYLKFNLAGIGTIKTAVLRIYGFNKETNEPIKVSAFEAGDNWEENTITWNNAPVATGAKRGGVDVTDALQYYQMDVTDYVKEQLAGDKIVSLMLANTELQNRVMDFNSKENSAFRPELIITGFGADTEPPTPVANLTSPAKSATTVSLTWTAATDNFGVAGYNIYQGTQLKGTTRETSYTVTGLASSSRYNFTVKARDESGNESAGVSLSVTTEVAPLVATLLPVADSYVRTGTATTNYGNDAVMKVKGTGDLLERRSYMKFDLSANTAVKTAVLRLYGYNVENNDGVRVTFSETSDNWQENTINWNNAPAAVGTPLGVLTINATKQYHEIDLTEYVKAQVSGDKVLSIVLTNPARQFRGVDIHSKENAEHKPVLIITREEDFEAPSAVSNLASPAQSATTVDLTWSAATDNIAVSGYNVYVGAELWATVKETGMVVSNLAPRTPYQFTVKARDDAGNESEGVSLEAATNSAVNAKLLPVADSYVRTGTATTNYGSESILKVKGTGDLLERRTYLKFDLPVVSTVKSAVLRFYGYNVENTDGIIVSAFATGNNWQEGFINWNNAPAPAGARIGSVTVDATKKYYEIDVTNFLSKQTSIDRIISLVLVNSVFQYRGVDIHSRENAENKPELIITGTLQDKQAITFNALADRTYGDAPIT